MDLFYSSGLLADIAIGSSLLDYLNDKPGKTTTEHNNFIRFLQVASALEVPLLPLTWDPAFEALGRAGATGHVNQAPLNAGITLAFKRFNPQVSRPDISQDSFRQIQYNAMIAEMTILMRKDIRRHQNIILFVGVCFELSSVSDDVWPVLVFNKADLGNLHTFLSHLRPLNVPTLATICGEVAKGIDIMHQCGVIHSDIKPTNVLVETDIDLEDIKIKVADFGFSSFATAGNSGAVKLARTEPWEAPEWHHRYTTLENAKKMDFYGFGLLLLWALFRDRPIPQLVEPSLTLEEALFSTDTRTTARVQALKKNDDSVLKCALQLLQETKDVDDQDRIRLEKAFTLTLSSKPASRAQSMRELVELLGLPEGQDVKNSNVIDSSIAVVFPEWHGLLQIEKTFFHLEMSDFRVHSYIVKTLKNTANGAGCLICQRNAAFQLTLCYSIGFGVTRDDSERDIWIEKSGKSPGDLQDTLDRIRTENRGANVVVSLYKMGYRTNLLDRYNGDGLLLEATIKYRAMVDCREKVLGKAHSSTLRLKSVLVDLLDWTGEVEEALLHALSNLHNVGADVDICDRLALKGQLAHIYEQLGMISDAEAARLDMAQEYDEDPNEKDNPAQMYNRVRLARLLLAKGDSEQALEVSLTVEKEAVLSLGPYHSTSREAKKIVVEALDATGQLEMAVSAHENLIRTEEKCLKADHGLLIEALAILGVQYYRLTRLDSASICYNKVMALVTQMADYAIPAITSINNYATRILRYGSTEEGVNILQNLLKEAERILGRDREPVVAVMGNLAAAYQKQKNWTDAEPLERYVLDFRLRTYGEKHRHTLSAFSNLARTLMHKRKWADAATICKRELEIRDSISETTDAVRIDLLSSIGKTLTISEAYAEAAGIFNRLFSLLVQQQQQQQQQDEAWQDSSNGEASPSHVQDMALAALCQAKLGIRSHARRQISILLDMLQSPWRELPNVLVDHLTFIAKACDKENWDEETEQVLAAGALVVEKYREHLGAAVLNRLLATTEDFLKKNGKVEVFFHPETLEWSGT